MHSLGGACTRAGEASPRRLQRSGPVLGTSSTRRKIERFDVTVLTPTGGDVTGFLLVRGTAEQIDSVRRTKEYQLLLSRVQLITTHLRIADAFVDEGLAQIMGQYQEVVEKVG